MNEQEPNDMEKWMTTWRTTPGDHLIWLREDFAKKKLYKQIQDFGALAAYGFALTALLFKAITVPVAVTIAAVALFGPYFAVHSFLLVRKIQTRRDALPLSGPEYVTAMEHNLELEERELWWEQRTLPVAIAAGCLIFAWMIIGGWDDMTAQLVAFVLVVAVGGFGYASWSSYHQKPEKLRRQRRALQEVADSLRSQE